MSLPRFSVVAYALLRSGSAVDICARDGSDYSYSESISGQTRTITYNGCPNHPWYQLNPNYPVKATTTKEVPAYPKFEGSSGDMSQDSANIDLREQGGDVGVFFNGAQLFSPYGGPSYGQASSFQSSATYAEGQSFDQCGCHGSSTSSVSYHCHVPPSCLLQQLGQSYSSGSTSGAHSPQIGWADDGFPVYGPHGLGGVMMQTCTVTGGTYGSDVCTDDCGGYYSSSGDIDNYVYRYYVQGTYSDGSSCDSPGCPSPGADYHPHTPNCYRGCCPSGASCENTLPSCTNSASDGYLDGFTASAPVVNGFDLSEGLSTNSAACACSDTTTASCSSQSWKDSTIRQETQQTCPASSPTPSASPSPTASASPSPTASTSPTPTASSNPSPSPTTSNSNPGGQPAPAPAPATESAETTGEEEVVELAVETITEELIVDADYTETMGANDENVDTFLDECTTSVKKNNRNAICSGTQPGSIIVDLTGTEEDLDAVLTGINETSDDQSYFDLSSFPGLRFNKGRCRRGGRRTPGQHEKRMFANTFPHHHHNKKHDTASPTPTPTEPTLDASRASIPILSFVATVGIVAAHCS